MMVNGGGGGVLKNSHLLSTGELMEPCV